MANPQLLEAVRGAAEGTYDVLGELGAVQGGSGMVYLARELASGDLLALKLEAAGRDAIGNEQYYLDEARALDASTPDVEMRCPRCHGKLRQWARFCTQCGLDVSGEAPKTGDQTSRAALRERVRAATAGQYDFLGEMPRAEGGGLVYFARDLSDGKIVALRLQRDLNQKLEVGVTRTLKAVDTSQRPRPAPAVTILQRAVAPRPVGAGGAARMGGGIRRTPNEAPAANAERESGPWWKRWRVEIAAVLAVVLLIWLMLSAL